MPFLSLDEYGGADLHSCLEPILQGSYSSIG